MNDKKFANQPNKRTWIQPTVAIIDLNVAKASGVNHPDGSGGAKS